MKLAKAARLRRRREFLIVQEQGQRVYAKKELVIVARPGSGHRPRIGITVSARIGNAVARNRIKRWVREAFRAEAPGLPPVDLVVVARSGADRLEVEGVRGALRAAAARLASGREGTR